MNATGLWADLVLPCTAHVRDPERDGKFAFGPLPRDQRGAGGGPAPGEAKTDLEITLEAGQAASASSSTFNEDPGGATSSACWNPPASRTTSWWRRRASTWWERNEGWIAYKDGQFFTSTGKARVCGCRNWVDEGFPPIACLPAPCRTRRSQRRRPGGASTRWPPCSASCARRCTPSSRTWTRCWTWYGHEPHGLPACRRTPRRAASSTATRWRPTTTAASMRGTAFVTDHVKQGVVVLENGWDDAVNETGSSSHVTSNAYPVLGTTHCCNSDAGRSQEGGIDHDSGIPCGNRPLLRLQDLHGRLRERASAEPRRAAAPRAPDRRCPNLWGMPSSRWAATTATSRRASPTARWAPTPSRRTRDWSSRTTAVCIGCKTCIEACPFRCARPTTRSTSTTFKCDGCIDRRAAGAAARVHRGVPEREHLPGRVRNGAFRACRRRFGQGRLRDASEPGGDARPRHHGGGVRRHRRHGRDDGPWRRRLPANRLFDPLRRRRLTRRRRNGALPARRAPCGPSRACEGERGGPCCILPGATSRGGWGSPQ